MAVKTEKTYADVSDDQYQIILELVENKSIAFRSCWNCNLSHEHMKGWDDVLLQCFVCGHLFWNGYRLTNRD